MRLNNAKTVYFSAEGVLVDAEFPGCYDFFPLVSLEGFLDGVFFHLLECQTGGHKHGKVFRDKVYREVSQVNQFFLAQDKGMLYCIF